MFERLRSRYEAELFGNVTPFWERHSIDAEIGGFFSCLDRAGNVYDTLKQMWMQWREVYMFAALFNSSCRQDRWLDVAERGATWLQSHGRKGPGRYAFMLNRRGEVTEDAPGGSADFTACFAAMACAELFRATGKLSYRDEALACLAAYDESCVAAERPCADLPARIVYRQLAHPMFRLNVLLVLDRCGIGSFGREMDMAIAEMKLFREPTTGLLFERRLPTGGIDLASQDGRFVNPGHSLEGLSFALQRIRISRNPNDLAWALAAVKRLGEFGIDERDGGLTYYRDGLDLPVAKFEAPLKVWWGNCESASAFLEAYELSNDEWFLRAFESIDHFNFTHLKDPEQPEWFAYAAVDGRQFHTYKGSRFKTFFHLPRYLLNCIEIMERMK